MGGSLTMVGNSPLIMLNDLIALGQPQPALGRSDADAVPMFPPLPIGIALLVAGLLYYRYPGRKWLRDSEGELEASRRRAPKAISPRPMASKARSSNSRSARTVRWSACDRRSRSAAATHPSILALQTGSDARLSPRPTR